MMAEDILYIDQPQLNMILSIISNPASLSRSPEKTHQFFRNILIAIQTIDCHRYVSDLGLSSYSFDNDVPFGEYFSDRIKEEVSGANINEIMTQIRTSSSRSLTSDEIYRLKYILELSIDDDYNDDEEEIDEVNDY